MKPLEDYSFIRGVCHNPTLGLTQQELEERLERELGFCQKLNLNSIRFWMEPEAYDQDPKGYLDVVETFITMCRDRDISVMPIIWNGNFITDFVEPSEEWYEKAMKANSLSENPDVQCNCFRIKSRQSLKVWRRNGWIYGYDLRGWFEWYCRFFLGRRDPDIDKIQIGRWKAFRRHVSQVEKNCIPSDIECRPRQRQALLQWAYNPFI